MRPKPIIVVQGGQWGSEAKGAVTAALCLLRPVDIAVRTGAINAGHSVVYGGVKYAMQQIPCGWVNPNTQLVIGAGAYIHPPTLFREIKLINEAMPDLNVLDRLFIDYRCGVHDEAAESRSKDANRHHSIGATGKGCSEAIVAKIQGRNAGYKLFREWVKDEVVRTGGMDIPVGIQYVDTVDMLNSAYDGGHSILIEGTQGTALDLHLGPYPYTTSRMTSAANWVAECGLSPALNYEVVLVCRTYPIRVAGNSGPMPGETEWVDIARGINNKLSHAGLPPLVSIFALQEFETRMECAASQAVLQSKYKVPMVGRSFKIRLSEWTPTERNQFRAAASELHRDALALCRPETVTELRKLFELTTVTRKMRRIAKLDIPSLKEAIAINRPSWIAMTFMDYVIPQLANATADVIDPTYRYVMDAAYYIDQIESACGVPVKYITTGPKPEHFVSSTYIKSKVSDR